MVTIRLAIRNLLGAGLRTWLNVTVLSFSFVVIIWHRGFLDGWNRMARHDMIDWEIGGGQYWHEAYDPYDPFTLTDSHGKIPEVLQSRVTDGAISPILISQATVYPDGRLQSVLLKGIDPGQKILAIPSDRIESDMEEIPAMIGARMAGNTHLKTGDYVTVRWRDANGIFDAAELKIMEIFKTDVPTVDNGQVWIPLDRLREMLQMPGETTILVVDKNVQTGTDIPGWSFKDHSFLLSDIDRMISQKKIGGAIIYFLLLMLALLAVFDTQILSIFRRQREIGTIIALGMTRIQVVGLFTLEGALHAVFAAIVGAVYGIPLLALQASKGFSMPAGTDGYGIAIAERLYPAYSLELIVGTVLIVSLGATLVSFLPASKIARMRPADAIRGKHQ
jgi:ABC-type lipoprotein release transport system permease subunit